jgi:chemotaxis protein methyltransferase CheR
MAMFDSEWSMSDEEFHLFRNSIYQHCGIHFDPGSKYLLEKRLVQRMTALNIRSFREYYRFLTNSRHRDQEMTDLMDILTVNETYFFRESHQLATFTDEIIPELISSRPNQGQQTMRIWSAGCSTGEEPYSIAMLLFDIPGLNDWKIEIVGTDISQRVLQHARLGLFGRSSFRDTDEYYRKRFFQKQGDGYRIIDDLRRFVSFSQLNLFDTDRVMLLGRMDLIFCRNVIIYFDLEAQKRVVASFHRLLFEGGFLLLGHSESLMNISQQFSLRHFRNDMIYQKPDRSSPGGEP